MREADTERLLGFSITLTSFPKLGVCRVCVQPGSDSLPPAFWDPRQLGSETQGLWLKLGTAHTRTQTHTQTRRTSLKVGSAMVRETTELDRWDRSFLCVCQLNLSLPWTSLVARKLYCIHSNAHAVTLPLDLVSGQTGSPQGHKHSCCTPVCFSQVFLFILLSTFCKNFI